MERDRYVMDLALARRLLTLCVADSVGIVIWSNIEVCVGMMVACMPHVRQLMRDAMLQRGQSRPVTSSSAEGIFIDRSLRTI